MTSLMDWSMDQMDGSMMNRTIEQIVEQDQIVLEPAWIPQPNAWANTRQLSWDQILPWVSPYSSHGIDGWRSESILRHDQSCSAPPLTTVDYSIKTVIKSNSYSSFFFLTMVLPLLFLLLLLVLVLVPLTCSLTMVMVQVPLTHSLTMVMLRLFVPWFLLLIVDIKADINTLHFVVIKAGNLACYPSSARSIVGLIVAIWRSLCLILSILLSLNGAINSDTLHFV
jgi:hypothetical protein